MMTELSHNWIAQEETKLAALEQEWVEVTRDYINAVKSNVGDFETIYQTYKSREALIEKKQQACRCTIHKYKMNVMFNEIFNIE